MKLHWCQYCLPALTPATVRLGTFARRGRLATRVALRVCDKCANDLLFIEGNEFRTSDSIIYAGVLSRLAAKKELPIK